MDGGRLDVDARHAAGVAGPTVGEVATTLNARAAGAIWSERGNPKPIASSVQTPKPRR
jgi:hypothetical protein